MSHTDLKTYHFRQPSGLDTRRRQAFAFELRAEEGDTGIVSGYASTFTTKPDSYNSVVLPGAFTNTLAKGLSRIKVLWNHNPDDPIGKLLEAREDNIGLWVRYQLSLGVQKAADIYTLIKDGVIDSMSFGFSILSDDYKDGVWRIKEVDLWDVSPVTFPANQEAMITGVRSEEAEPSAEEIDAAVQAVRMYRSLLEFNLKECK
jgi:HK97 family phage prohead protease